MGNAANLFDMQAQAIGKAGKSHVKHKSSLSKQPGIDFNLFLNQLQKDPTLKAAAGKTEGKNLLIADAPKAEFALFNPAPAVNSPIDSSRSSVVPQVIQLPKGSVEFGADGAPKIKPEAFKRIAALLKQASGSSTPMMSDEKPNIQSEVPVKKGKSTDPSEERPFILTPLSGLEMRPQMDWKPSAAITPKEDKSAIPLVSNPKASEVKTPAAIMADMKVSETNISNKKDVGVKVSDTIRFETKNSESKTPVVHTVNEKKPDPPVFEGKTPKIKESDNKVSDRKTFNAILSDGKLTDVKSSNIKTIVAKISEIQFPEIKTLHVKKSGVQLSEIKLFDEKSSGIKTQDEKIPLVKPVEIKPVEAKPVENESKRPATGNHSTPVSPVAQSQPIGTIQTPQKIGMKSTVDREELKAVKSSFQSSLGDTVKIGSTVVEPQTLPVQAIPARMSKPVLLSVHPDDIPPNLKNGESKKLLLADGEFMKQIEPSLSEKLAQSAQVLVLEVQSTSVDENQDGKENQSKFGVDKNTHPQGKSIVHTLEKAPSVTESGFQVLRSVEPPADTKKAQESLKTESVKSLKTEGLEEMKPLPAQSNKGQTQDNNSQLFQQQVKAQLTATALNNMAEKKPEPAPAPKPAAQENAPLQTQTQSAHTVQNNPPQSMTAAQTAQEVNPGSMSQEYSEQIAKLQESVSQQVVKGVQGSFGSERSHISIQLTPESLGKVVVQMTLTSGQLVAQIQADKDSTRALLERNLGALRSAFDEQGIKVERLVIAKDTHDYNRQEMNREQSSDRSRQSRNESESKYANEQKGEQGQNRQDHARRNAYVWTDRLDARNYYF